MHHSAGTTWQDFETWLAFVESERARLRAVGGLSVSRPLYRGQADAAWRLESTLERHFPNCMSVHDYYERVCRAKSQIEAHTGRNWSPMSTAEYELYVSESRLHYLPSEGTVEYLAYLRHHGFPSPLLDWTQSPYVAAYFALGPAVGRTERVAIYAFLEHAGHGKETRSFKPGIHVVGSSIRGHRRHFLQQSEYTFCVQQEAEEWRYVSHELAVVPNFGGSQDLIYKFTMPARERSAALRHLDRFNLNAFSLLGSEESLMETVALRTLSDE